MKDKKLIGIVAAVVVVLGGVLFMMDGGGSKPEASFDLIKAAVEKKDVEEVEKYIDFLSLAESVMSAEAFWGKDIADMSDPFNAATVNSVKADISKKFRKFVSDGNLMDGVTVSEWSGRTSDDMSGYQKATGFRYWSYVSAGASKKDRGETIVPVTIHDMQVEKDYVLDVVMNKENSVWRVKGIKNLDAFIEARKDDEKAKIDEINKATLEKIAEALSISNAKMTYYNKYDLWFGQHHTRIAMTLKNNTGKTVSRVEGRVYLYKPGTEEKVQVFRISKNATIKPGEEYQLNDSGHIDKYENITASYIVENFSSFEQKYEITSVKFADETELKLGLV